MKIFIIASMSITLLANASGEPERNYIPGFTRSFSCKIQLESGFGKPRYLGKYTFYRLSNSGIIATMQLLNKNGEEKYWQKKWGEHCIGEGRSGFPVEYTNTIFSIDQLTNLFAKERPAFAKFLESEKREAAEREKIQRYVAQAMWYGPKK